MNNPLIKNVFGNHNKLQLFIKYVTSKDKSVMPPWPLIMYRSVDIDTPDEIMINSKYKHEAYIKKLKKELLEKYPTYQLNIYC
jgi:hypothetical protein